MDFQPSRLRRGEVIAGVAAAILIVLMFAVPWYGRGGEAARGAAALGLPSSIDGWDGLPTLRWLILITVVAALALAFFQATHRAPALPVSLSVIVTALGSLTALGLIYRVLIAVPGSSDQFGARAGAYLGLASALALLYGGYRSLREEERPDADRNAAIPTVELEPRHDRPAAPQRRS
jgi:hypothetical protein